MGANGGGRKIEAIATTGPTSGGASSAAWLEGLGVESLGVEGLGVESLGIGGGTLALLFAVYLLSGMVKGALGFGLPLIAGAVLPQFVPLALVLAINAVILPATNVVQFVAAGGRHGVWRHWPVLLGLLVAVPLAALVVVRADPRLVAIAFGSFVAIAAALTWAVPRWLIPEPLGGVAGLATGLLGGLVTALTTAPGPVFVLYLIGRGAERRETMAALGLFLLLSGALAAASFWMLGLLDVPRLVLALACLAPALIGMRLGDALASRVSADRLRGVVLAVLVLLGLRTAVAALLDG